MNRKPWIGKVLVENIVEEKKTNWWILLSVEDKPKILCWIIKWIGPDVEMPWLGIWSKIYYPNASANKISLDNVEYDLLFKDSILAFSQRMAPDWNRSFSIWDLVDARLCENWEPLDDMALCSLVRVDKYSHTSASEFTDEQIKERRPQDYFWSNWKEYLYYSNWQWK